MGKTGLVFSPGIYLERPRIDRLLEKALESRVVTVVAGEGYGKTHAVNTFLQERKRQTVWIQLSERDNLGWRFWENYTGEVARLKPEAAKIFSDIGFPESGRQFDRYLSLLENRVISKERYVVVLDDFHLLTNPTVLLFLERTLTAPISTRTVVFISRTEPAINTLNLLAKGLLSQITVDDLRFTREETGSYFRLHTVSLEEEDLTRIFHETEGWALALGLILQEIKTVKDSGYRWDRAMQPIREMEEDIFSTMEEELQKFLIKLSLIERWPRNLLERLEPGGKSIAAMEKFSSVIRFDVYLHGFRIHHLFLDFLREKQKFLSHEEIRDVCREGAQWCIENNLPTDAAVSYERARDYGGLGRLIESLPRMMPRTMAVFFLETVERLMAENPGDGEDEDFLFLRFIIRPRLLTFLGRFDEAFDGCRGAVSYFEAQPPDPRRSRILTAAYNNLGILCILSSRKTHDYDFVHWFEKAHHYYLENPNPVHGQLSQTNIGAYIIQTGVPAGPGEIDAFINAVSQSVPHIAASRSGFLYGIDFLVRAELAYYQGDLIRAEQFALQTVYRSREKKQYEVENRGLFYLMRIGVHKGDITGIQEIEQQLNAQLENSEYLYRYTTLDILIGRFYSRLGLTEKVASWLRNEDEAGEFKTRLRGFDTLIMARCLLWEKNYSAALQALVNEKSDLAGFILGFLEMKALEAVIHHQLGDKDRSFNILKQAYDAAQPNSLDMPFIEMGEHMAALVNAVLKEGENKKGEDPPGKIPRAWLQTIQKKASAFAKKRSLVAAHYLDQETAEASEFSAWELEILNNLSQGRTSEEIAGNMNTSINMIKSAVRSLYVKLGAVNRAGAIRLALKKGLLSGSGG
ncbi:MAG: LuxR C-terminal-related transcriptional regulator [Spirochaetaceae bacterium]|jgi:LuxR family maltose regulon positive regulatory protein|nr:LuxR C-terminal-related transcriptional regulator [Spirochaetaceae bacterium]